METPQRQNVGGSMPGALSGQYLSFVIGGETFAIGILQIKEIIEYGEITDVPLMPPFLRGVINLRGRVVPVVDLSARFGRATTVAGRRTCIVIVETFGEGEQAPAQDIGILVDAVNEVIEIAGVDIEPSPAFGAYLRPDFIAGMAKRGERFIILLNVERVLSVDDMALLGQAYAEQPPFKADSPPELPPVRSIKNVS